MDTSPQTLEYLIRAVSMELNASMIYMTIRSFFSAQNLPYTEEYFEKQIDEELGHSKKVQKFLGELGIRYVVDTSILQGIPSPSSPKGAIEAYVSAELTTTEFWRELYSVAEENKDCHVAIFAQWFISEQIEEENQSQIAMRIFTDNSSNLSLADQLMREAFDG